MIALSEVIDHLTSGEFTQLSITKELLSVDAAKVEIAQKKVVKYADLAMVELHKRFDLRTIQADTITGILDTYTYTLTIATNDRLLKLSALYNDDGLEYRINDENDSNSVTTPVYNQIYIPSIEAGDILYPIVVVAPPTLTWTADVFSEGNDIEIPVPISMLEALLHYIGYRGHGSLDGAINTENNTHLMRFEASCQRLTELGLGMEYNTIGNSFNSRGFI